EMRKRHVPGVTDVLRQRDSLLGILFGVSIPAQEKFGEGQVPIGSHSNLRDIFALQESKALLNQQLTTVQCRVYREMSQILNHLAERDVTCFTARKRAQLAGGPPE